jgi:Dyp-type peroxidase family
MNSDSQAVGQPLAGPLEPVLDMSDIQGIAVPGFFKPSQTLIGIRYSREGTAPALLKKFLKNFAPQVATAASTLDDRRAHRGLGDVPKGKPLPDFKPLVAIAFSYPGLFGLTLDAASIRSEAFKNGMVRRSSMLGDPTDPSSPGHPTKWVVGRTGAELDILIIVAGDDRPSVDARAAPILASLHELGIEPHVELGDTREDAPGHEHFGFDDGVSQPGIRGRASEAEDDFITDRYVDPSQIPAAWLFGYPGQDLVWPGEFVFGYPASGADPLFPGPSSPAAPGWTTNGAFLVYRRLRQDVPLFWKTMKSEAERLSKLPGFEHLDELSLASKLVGRWPSGAPVSRLPKGDDDALGSSKVANNHFRFDSDTPELKLTGKNRDSFPRAAKDPVGLRCPLSAHIRKVNTRDSSSDMGARSSTYERRLLRVGVPFGASWPRNAKSDPAKGDRGLQFLSIQSSLEEQFEFLQARWMNDESRPKSPGGHDMIVGQNTPTADGVRRCVIFGEHFEQAQVSSAGQFIVPTGGGYFFVPSISALSKVIAGPAAVHTVSHSAKATRPARKQSKKHTARG